MRAGGADVDRDAAAGWRELQRIRQQIEEHLFEPARIGHHGDG